MTDIADIREALRDPVIAAYPDFTRAVSDVCDDVARMRDFLGKVQGVCMGVAISGRDHPNPDGALMELFNEAQAILFPPAPITTKGPADE